MPRPIDARGTYLPALDGARALDKIHFTTPGYQQRAHRIAEATAIAFPKGRQSPHGCLIPTPGWELAGGPANRAFPPLR